MIKTASETLDIPMDWENMELPTPKNARPRCGELGAYDYWRLQIAAKVTKKSLSQTLQTAALTYLNRNWQEHERRLILEAKQKGITPEQLFIELCDGDSDP